MSTRLDRRDVSESLAGVGVACLASVVTLALSGMLRIAFDRFSIAEGAAIATSLALAILAAKGPPRLVAGAGVGVVIALGAMVLVGTSWVLSEPLVSTQPRCGTGDIGVPFFLAVVGFVGAAIALPIALVGRIGPRAALVASVAFIVAGAAIAGLGVRSLAKPEPDSYLRLFEKKKIDPGASAVVGGRSVRYDATPRPAPLLGDRKCTVAVGEERVGVYTFDDTCPSIELAYDPVASRVLVLREPGGPVGIVGSVAGCAPDVLGIADFRGRLGAPRAWVFGAVGGLALAMGALAMALRCRRRARRSDDAIEANHAGAGWVTVDGAPRYVPHLATRAPGPVVIVTRDASRAPTYRDDGAAKIFKVVPGNRMTLREEAHARMAAWALVAIASVMTTSAPLWIARMYGIL